MPNARQVMKSIINAHPNDIKMSDWTEKEITNYISFD